MSNFKPIDANDPKTDEIVKAYTIIYFDENLKKTGKDIKDIWNKGGAGITLDKIGEGIREGVSEAKSNWTKNNEMIVRCLQPENLKKSIKLLGALTKQWFQKDNK